MADLSRLCIHQVTLRDQWNFRESVEGLSRHGIRSTALWREKLEEVQITEAARILKDHGMEVQAICAGMLQNPLDENRRLIEQAAAVGARCVVLISGGVDASKNIESSRRKALDAAAALIPEARAAGIILGIEPLHPMVCANRAVLCTLKQANDWCDELDADDAVGVVVDTYSVWWDPEMPAEIVRAGSRICGFHINDWLEDTRDIRLDRGMIGDGVIDIPAIQKLVEQAGYEGPSEVEIFSERNWWKRDPDEVIRVIKERFQTAL